MPYFATLTGVKSANLAVALVGDTVTYTIAVTNTGNAPAVNVVISDSIPPGTTLLPGSISIDDVPQLGTDPSAIDLGTIQPGSTATVTLELLINALPEPPQIVNTATIESDVALPSPNPPVPQAAVAIPPNVLPIADANLNVALSANRSVTVPGDTIAYTITAANSGNTNLTNVAIIDPLPAGTSFIASSVTVNGVPLPGADPAHAINTGRLMPGQLVTFTFQALVTSAANTIANQAQAFFIPEILGRSLPPQAKASNRLSIPVLHPNLDVAKQADRTEARLGDAITYSIAVTNSGNTNLKNVAVSDTLPASTQLVAGSITINGSPSLPGANMPTGLQLGSLAPNQSASIGFRVLVVAEAAAVIANQAQASFTPDVPGLSLPPQTKASNRVVIAVAEDEE
ncbi:DUF11 domain-containing protein [Paenibacillus sp. MMS18-CY102]|uniref:DUF11 domain-containing protein n=1 Tax=Paenibacillus sp. MMS18-CY102 TaxID=2682849 RepID=UPI001365CD1A|nr:DUF11 domain-containing protein [Paenibacillus sp. MMS18-CY102]MWC29788.1 DUF11 domain-containing protein [Paenibacillus sp. MMS18-CY102]